MVLGLELERILRRACWNCHSNQTDWPAGEPDEVEDLAEEVGEQIEADAMPPTTYRWMHPEARLDEEERQVLLDWSMATGGPDRLPGELP